MSRRNKEDSDKQLTKLALITASLALATSIINLLERLIEWLTKT